MSLQLVTPPAGEPVSLAEAKLHLRVDVDDDDALIGSLISAARQAAETLTGRQLNTARWKLVLDAFPCRTILLTKCPVQSVVNIQYLDMNGMSQALPLVDYVVDTACEPARISPVFGKTWPPTLPQIGAVTVTFDAGYGAASAVPEGLKSWIKLRVGSLYAHREEMSILMRGRIDPLPFVDGLLDPYRVALV
ncbi:MAG: head-tail connector protein [Burkholderiaceae bacterium]